MRSGAVFIFKALVLVLLASVAGCDEVGSGTVIELGGESVSLPPGASIHDVHLRHGAGAAIEPDTVVARPGDAVRFTAQDDGGHAVAFEPAPLDTAALRFLEETNQLRGPPLVDSGTRWIVNLRDAPPGRYEFTSLTTDDRGLLIVRED